MTGPRKTKLSGSIDLAAAVEQAIELFGGEGRAFILIGGAALQAYGIVRATKDVDFAVTRADCAAVEAIARAKNLPVTQLTIGGISVDLGDATADFIDRRFEVEALFSEAIDAAKRANFTIQTNNTSVLVVPLEYLIALKMVGVRPQDEADVANLLRDPTLNYRDARHIVETHLGGVAARYLDKAARQAGRRDAPTVYD